jgi:hypothetical protein
MEGIEAPPPDALESFASRRWSLVAKRKKGEDVIASRNPGPFPAPRGTSTASRTWDFLGLLLGC